jgi:hypothetical protein
VSALQTTGEVLVLLFFSTVLPSLLLDFLFPPLRTFVRPNLLLQSTMKFRWPWGPIGRKAKEPPTDDTSVMAQR